jgi:hypothetical protein
MRMFSVLAVLSLSPVASACTLTSDPFEPKQVVAKIEVDASAAPTQPVSTPPASAPDRTPGAECVGSSQLPACLTELVPPATDADEDSGVRAVQAASCNDDSDCASGNCEAGRCRAASSDASVTTPPPPPRPVRCADAPDCATGELCRDGADCASHVCANAGCAAGDERCCQAPSCEDGVRNGSEPVADCGGGCGGCEPGAACNIDADCQSGACERGRCCGGVLVDCTRCARRLVQGLSCETSPDPVATANCNAFLDCLADNPALCPVRHADGCSADPGGVCDHTRFGGNGGPGIALADSILGTAVCFF